MIAGKALQQHANDRRRVVDRQGGLRDVGEVRRVARREARGILDRLDQADRAFGQLAHGADHFGMAGMADQHDLAIALEMDLRFLVHLGDERAGRVQEEHLPRPGAVRHRFGHAMRGEDDRLAVVGDLVQLLDEDGALGASGPSTT